MNLRIVLSIIAIPLIFSAYGQSNPVIDSLENIIDLAKADTVKVKCLNELSSQYRNIRDYEMALQCAESAFELAKTLNYHQGIGDAYANSVKAYIRMNRPADFYEFLTTSLKVFEEIGEKKGMASCHVNLGRVSGNSPEASDHFLTALKLSEEIGDKNGIAAAYINLGGLYQRQHKYQEALEATYTSIKNFEEAGNKVGASHCYNDIGNIYLTLGNPAKALENFLASLEIKEEIGHKEGAAHSYNNIGNVYQKQGNYPEALEYYMISLKIKEEAGLRRQFTSAYNNIGEIYQIQGHYPEALEQFQASLEIVEEFGDQWGIANSYNYIGRNYECQGQYPVALEYFLSSLRIFEEIGSKGSIAESYNNIGTVHQKQGNYEEALRNHFASFNISKEIGAKESIARSYINIGIVYQKQGVYQDARKYLNDGLALSKELGNKGQIKDIYKTLSTLDSAEGNSAGALEHHKLYTLYKDSLFNEEGNYRIALMRIHHETDKKDQEIELLNKDKALQEEHLERQKLLRNAMLAGVFLIVMVGLLLFRSFRLRKKLEKQQAIIQERQRISADLHDDVGSGLSKITLLSELLKKQAKTPENRKEAEKISKTALELSATISEIIWALNANNDYLENMVTYIRRYAAEYFENTPVKLKTITDGTIVPAPINGEHRRNIFYTVKEALNNILKHAEATEAELKFVLEDDKLDVIISDNGKGIPEGNPNRFGNGINNMRARMKSISGDFKIVNHHGTRIILKLAL